MTRIIPVIRVTLIDDCFVSGEMSGIQNGIKDLERQ